MDRFNTTTGQAALEAVQGVNNLRAEITELKSVVASLLIASLQGTPPDLSQEPFRTFFRIPAGLEPAEALAHAARVFAPTIGKVNCPSCGAVVHDLAGVADERCVFCGHVLTTER